METIEGNLELSNAKINKLVKEKQQKVNELRSTKLNESPQEIEKLEKEIIEIDNDLAEREKLKCSLKQKTRSQIYRIKETVVKILDKNITLRDKINTLFREQGITIVSILTAISLAISLAISTIVASIVASVKPVPTPVPPTPPTPPTPSSGGVKEWIQKIYQSC